MTTSYTEIADKKVNFTGFAGLSGRFDFGGPARSRERRVAGRVAGNLAVAPSRAHTLDGSPKID